MTLLVSFRELPIEQPIKCNHDKITPMKDNIHVCDSRTIPNTYEPAPPEGWGPIIVVVIVIWA